MLKEKKLKLEEIHVSHTRGNGEKLKLEDLKSSHTLGGLEEVETFEEVLEEDKIRGYPREFRECEGECLILML